MALAKGDIMRRGRPSARRAEQRGFQLARQRIAPDLVERARLDDALRLALAPIRELLKTHVYPDAEARDAACRLPMLNGVFELLPTTARDLKGSPGLFHPAIGPRLREPGFASVAEAVADPEIDAAILSSRPTVITIAGVHYQLRPHGGFAFEVDAKAPFDAAEEDEVRDTAAWLGARAIARARRA